MKAELVIALLLVGNALGATGADRGPAIEQTPARLLTHAEGEALVHLALERPMANPRPDCSHLVHQTLSAAGLTYPYANSFKIFAGVPQFRRVRNAQPGDLIVWPGHVGIVVDPERSTFFSSTGSGLRTDEYTGDYWRHRGHPRFYRYLVGTETDLAALRTMPRHDGKQSHRAEKKASVEQPAAPEQSESDATATESRSSDPADAARDHDFPKSIQIVTDHVAPMKDEIDEAISELTNAAVSALEADNRRSISLVFVRSLKVEKVTVKGNKGWAQLRVDSHVELNPDGTWRKPQIQNVRCELRRDGTGWVLFTPPDRLYMPQTAAIPALAKQLAMLSNLPAASVERRQLGGLAAVLDLLLNED